MQEEHWSLNLPSSGNHDMDDRGLVSTPIVLPSDTAQPLLVALGSSEVYLVDLLNGSLLQTLPLHHDDYLGSPVRIPSHRSMIQNSNKKHNTLNATAERDVTILCTGPSACACIHVSYQSKTHTSSTSSLGGHDEELEDRMEGQNNNLKLASMVVHQEVPHSQPMEDKDGDNHAFHHQCPTPIGPLYKNAAMARIGSSSVTTEDRNESQESVLVVADSNGWLHVLQDTLTGSTIHHQTILCSVQVGAECDNHPLLCPLSSPSVIAVQNETFVVVGSYNCHVYCYQLVEHRLDPTEPTSASTIDRCLQQGTSGVEVDLLCGSMCLCQTIDLPGI